MMRACFYTEQRRGASATEPVTSKDNATVKLYRKLCASRRDREGLGFFAVEGLRLTLDAARSGVEVLGLLHTPQSAYKWPAALESVQAGRRIVISEALAEHISDTQSPQGVFAVCKMPPRRDFSPHPAGKYLMLDQLQDPGNVGTIIRTAEAFGMDGLILSPNCPDIYSPKVIRGTMGGVFRIPVHQSQDLVTETDQLLSVGIPVYCAMLSPEAIRLEKLKLTGGACAVIGNEGAGVSPQLAARCTGAVYIPMAGKAESLNAAIAASVIMWEFSRKKGGGCAE